MLQYDRLAGASKYWTKNNNNNNNNNDNDNDNGNDNNFYPGSLLDLAFSVMPYKS